MNNLNDPSCMAVLSSLPYSMPLVCMQLHVTSEYSRWRSQSSRGGRNSIRISPEDSSPKDGISSKEGDNRGSWGGTPIMANLSAQVRV